MWEFHRKLHRPFGRKIGATCGQVPRSTAAIAPKGPFYSDRRVAHTWRGLPCMRLRHSIHRQNGASVAQGSPFKPCGSSRSLSFPLACKRNACEMGAADGTEKKSKSRRVTIRTLRYTACRETCSAELALQALRLFKVFCLFPWPANAMLVKWGPGLTRRGGISSSARTRTCKSSPV